MRPVLLAIFSQDRSDSSFDYGRHCDAAPCRFDPQLLHKRVVDVECGLHMDNHINDMVIWLPPYSAY